MMKAHRSSPTKRRFTLWMVLLLTLLGVNQAMAFNVTGGITGWWEQTNQQNHGLIIATSQLPDGSQTGVVFWAHYDDEGQATWLLAQGPLDGRSIDADLYQVSGVSFMQAAGTVANPETLVGELVITFDDCKTGQAAFTTNLPGVGSGDFSISRLTTLSGINCSGGISDDISPTVETERFSVALTPSSAFPAAQGRVLWVLGGGSATLDIEIDNVTAADYDVIVDGVNRGTFSARFDSSDNAADGDIEFHSPQRSYHPLLDFDPRGKSIAITTAMGQTVLSGTLPTEGNDAVIDYEPIKGEQTIRQWMTNTGIYSQGYASAEFEQDDDGYTNFEVDVDNIPAGQYTVVVDTIARGTIHVRTEYDGDTEGEIEFYSPARAGYGLLDFDPRGALIEIMDGSSTLFYTDFPTTSGGSTTPGENSGGPGDNDDGPGDNDDGPGDNDDGPGDNDDGPGDNDDGPGDNDDGPGDNDDGPGDNNDGWSGYDQEQRLRLTNQGVYPQGRAMAEFSVDREGRELEIEVENVPAGTYSLTVGGVSRGTIRVFSEYDDGYEETEGEIEFSERPDDNDELLLDFTVRGEVIEILEGNTVIFSGTFPNA